MIKYLEFGLIFPSRRETPTPGVFHSEPRFCATGLERPAAQAFQSLRRDLVQKPVNKELSVESVAGFYSKLFNKWTLQKY